MKLPINLQLFADEEDIDFESGGYEGEEELDEELDDEEIDEELDDEDPETDPEEDPEGEEDNPSLDKKTKSIIKHRKENKALRQQLQEVQQKLQEKEIADETSLRVNELEREGKSSSEATRIAEGESEVKKLRYKLTNMELSKLEDKYPGISSYTQQLTKDKEILPEFSYEQIYLANYSKQSAFDTKTKLEQEMAYKNKNARNKSLDGGNTKQKKSTTLSKADERTFQFLKKSKPTLTRKQYAELLNSDTLE